MNYLHYNICLRVCFWEKPVGQSVIRILEMYKRYLNIFWICISLVSEVEHTFIHLSYFIYISVNWRSYLLPISLNFYKNHSVIGRLALCDMNIFPVIFFSPVFVFSSFHVFLLLLGGTPFRSFNFYIDKFINLLFCPVWILSHGEKCFSPFQDIEEELHVFW